MRVTRWYYGMEEGVALYNTWFNTRWSSRGERRSEGSSPTWRAPNFVARTRTEGRGIKRLSNVSHITESRECHPERGQSTFERIPGRPRTERAGERGVAGGLPRLPLPGRPPRGPEGAHFWGACFSGGPDSGPWPLGATAPSRGRTPPSCSCSSSEMFRRRR